MADGSVTIAAVLDTGAFQASVAALEGQLSGLSLRLQNAVAAAAAGSGAEGAFDGIFASLTVALGGLSTTMTAAVSGAARAAVLAFGSADWHGGGAQASGEMTTGFSAGAAQITALAGQTAKSARNAFGGGWHTVGMNMTGSIAAGIQAGAGSVVSAMAAVAARAMAAAKDALQIQSPSGKMRDEVGVMLSRGIAEGILAGSGYIEAALADVGGKTSVTASDMTGGVRGNLQQNIYLRTGTSSPYQTARAIRQQSELMLRT